MANARTPVPGFPGSDTCFIFHLGLGRISPLFVKGLDLIMDQLNKLETEVLLSSNDPTLFLETSEAISQVSPEVSFCSGFTTLQGFLPLSVTYRVGLHIQGLWFFTR